MTFGPTLARKKMKLSQDKFKMYNIFKNNNSLTTPPCNECVQWVVFREALEISEEQVKLQRDLILL